MAVKQTSLINKKYTSNKYGKDNKYNFLSMNNEEKILQVLSQLTNAVNQVQSDIKNLKETQTSMQSDIKILKETQTLMQSDIKEIIILLKKLCI